MSLILAADGGGTKTHVLFANEKGEILGEGTAGPSSLAATSVGAAGFNLREAVRQAAVSLTPGQVIDVMVMGLAGMDTPKEHEQSLQVFSNVLSDFTIRTFKLVNDIVIALEGGSTNPNALAIISGTGSNCYGRNAKGEEAKTGGMDYLLTDQGSGYEIGRYVLRSAVKSYDGRADKTVIEDLVCEHFHIPSIRDLKDMVYQPPLTKTEIAALAKVCGVALEQGDPVAKEIYDHVVAELYLMASTVITRLNMQPEAVDAVLSGSILKQAYIQQNFSTQLKAFCPQINIIVPDKDPVYGAMTMAIKMLSETGATPNVTPSVVPSVTPSVAPTSADITPAQSEKLPSPSA